MPDAGLEIDLVDWPDDAIADEDVCPDDVLLAVAGLVTAVRVPAAFEAAVPAEDAVAEVVLVEAGLEEVALEVPVEPDISDLEADLAVATLVFGEVRDTEACPVEDGLPDDVLVDAPPAYVLGLSELLLGLPSYLLP